MTNHKKIDNVKEFEKYQEDSREMMIRSKSRGDDFSDLLTGLYNDPSHFIYGILQNAEDVGAKEVRFELFEDRLDVYHDGIDFDLEDIKGVTRIGNSKKKDDLNAIGKFGVGFKSVFAITETPHIFSGKYRIKIEDFVIPSEVSNNNEINKTLIRLSFNHKLRSKKEVHELVAKKLKNIGLKTLLFLKNIKSIKFTTSSSDGHYLKSSKHFEGIKNAKEVTIKSSISTEEYIVIEKPIDIESKKLKVEIAYKLGVDEKGKKTIVAEPNSKLVIFFPTGEDTFLNFVIQGPYQATVTRENIPLENGQNKVIIEETGSLVAESLSIVKKLGYLDVNFLNILPIKQEYMEEQIYPIIYQKVKEKLLSDELLPTSNGKYIKAENSLLVRGKELTEFLDSKDIQKLFNKKNWLDTNITKDNTPELRNYLINELKVEEIDFEIFAEKIDIEFLQKKTDKWMIDFYNRLLNRDDKSHLIDILRNKPIVKLDTNKYIEPFNNEGKIQVYLPTETKSEYKTVKRKFVKDVNSLKFLMELGITKFDLFAEIREYILPKYQIDNSSKDKEYFEDFKKLLRAFETVPSDKKDELMNELSKTSFIDSVNNITGKNNLRKPSEIYFVDEDLKNYFNGYDFVYFVSDELYKKFEKEKLDKFLKELHVEDKPRRLETQGNLSNEEITKLQNRRAGACGYIGTRQIDYEFEGLKTLLSEITTEKSFLLWKLLLKNIKQEDYNFFKGELYWSHYTQYKEFFDAKFLKTLRSKAWLVDKNKNFKKSCEIAFSELSKNYNKNSPNIDILKDALEFKSESVDLLSEEEKQWVKLKEEGCSIEHVKELIAIYKKKSEPQQENRVSDWTHECEPDESEIPIEETNLSKIVTPDLKNQEPKTEVDESNLAKVDEATEENIMERVVSAQNKKKIGEHGEKTVYSSLKKGYKKDVFISIEETNNGFKARNGDGEVYEVIWLNKHRESGKGYDLKIKKGGVEIEYIEVKSKVGTEAEFVSASGAQWEFARNLFDNKEGDKYSFYVVTNTGKPDAKIHQLINPIKLWMEGKLYAHPVNFKL